MKIIDCRGLLCPRPVILTKKELESMESGEFEIIVDNDAARENVSKFAKNLGVNFEITEKDGFYHILMKKEITASAIANPKDQCEIMNFTSDKSIVIVIGNDKLGLGDDKLGAALMKSYVYALTESENKPNTLLFLNGGVRLTTEGSDVIESLKVLENLGTEIMSCGTCLDFYGLKEKLLIGSVSNMYTIVEKMNGATNTIKL